MLRRAGAITAVALAAFVIGVIARFPARWATAALPRGTSCPRLSGTLWSGTCVGLIADGTQVGDIAWTVHPLRLLTGALSADVAVSRPSVSARARIDLSPGGSMTAHAVRADLALDHALLPELPPSTHGTAHVDLTTLHWNGKRITGIAGQIDVTGLTGQQGEPLGDYRLLFPGPGRGASAAAGAGRTRDGTSSDPVGRLTDTGGPLAVEGTVRLTPEPGYVVEAQVAPRAGAPPDIVNALRFLGTPDAQGRRPFSLAGTF
ncbi:MAG: type II secretion system protein N [Steroidobacteraceae bacterium]